jgi:predicted SAM-dependent methyltransferase
MIELAKKIYRGIKYSVFTTRQKESLRIHKGRSQAVIQEYLSTHRVKKLQIGAQSNSITEWLNVDIQPKSAAVAYMDATKPFPFANNTFDFIYTEHMLEHISFSDATFMLGECFRVLKSNGKIRISTPDAAFLMALYNDQKTPVQEAYIKFSQQRYFKHNEPALGITVINNFFRDWGHQFIHDETSLRHLLETNGFRDFRRCTVGESAESHFVNVEQHGKEITDEYNRLESIIVEATKP